MNQTSTPKFLVPATTLLIGVVIGVSAAVIGNFGSKAHYSSHLDFTEPVQAVEYLDPDLTKSNLSTIRIYKVVQDGEAIVPGRADGDGHRWLLRLAGGRLQLHGVTVEE